jgi:hypothetical protein
MALSFVGIWLAGRLYCFLARWLHLEIGIFAQMGTRSLHSGEDGAFIFVFTHGWHYEWMEEM